MKRKILFILLLLITCFAIEAQPVKQHGQLKVVGTRLTDEKGKPVALHGMSFGWHNLWPRFYNAGAVKELVSKWKCTVVRASMGIENVNGKDGYLQLPDWSKQKMKVVVDAAIKQGVYVIIDWHSHNIQQKEAVEFFKEMATTYGKHPNIIYEIFNEPDYETWPEVKAYSEAVIKAIRSIDTNNIILVGSPKWDQEVQLPAADPIKGYSNLMYSMHFYAGTHKQWLRDRCDEAMKNGLPIFVSECAGMEASGDGPIDHNEWNKFVSWMDDRGLSWVAWSVSDKVETCSVLNPSAASTGKWKTKDVKEWGIIAREALKKLAN
ncbi:glycoside hydrolase family 5 protein [Ferruginibacter sp.]|nr:glycoside hydrolase family 5 protein [Ferruginibacter sp.]